MDILKKLTKKGTQDEENQNKTLHKEKSPESTQFFLEKGVGNNIVEYLLHNGITIMWCLVKISGKREGVNTQMLYTNIAHFEG